MAEKDTTTSANAAAAPRGPETQRERWVKYGGNVLLASVVVILLAIGITYFATRTRARIDTTQAGTYSLKPQTRAILRDLKQPVRVVSLYTQPDERMPPEEQQEKRAQIARVSDLLEEYERNSGGRIDAEVVDPLKQPTKVDALIAEVTEKYAGEVQKYRAFLEAYPKRLDEVKRLVTDAAAQVPVLPLANDNTPQSVQLAIQTIPALSEQLDKQKQSIDRLTQQKPPDYKGATDAVQQGMDLLSQLCERIAQEFQAARDDKALAEPMRKFLADSVPRYEAIKKAADAITADIGKLGELKLDELRQNLREEDAILVMGPKEMRSLSHRQVWQGDPNARRMVADGAELKPRFAGEQQLTSAVLALTQEKRSKIAFVRAGGPPLTQAGNPFTGAGGPLSLIADRLREYNFEVLEKDLSGMWAAQQQMQQQGMPPMPEPSEEEIKDAIWVVVSVQTGPTPMGNADIGTRVADHLRAGGSAMVLFEPQGDNLNAALADWGVSARTDVIGVHETSPATGAPTGDFINEAKRIPYVFVVNEYGDHMLAKPLRSLDAPMIAPVPVQVTAKAGVDAAPLLPIPTSPQSWGETDIDSVRNDTPKYNEGVDLKGPLFAGAAAQKKDGGRLVALGSVQFVTNDMLRVPDAELRRRGYLVSRFPGSAELFTNGVLWLAKMEPMIAISPAAMEVNRIENIGPRALGFWRVGVRMIGLPLAVILAGTFMYVRRRD